MGTARDEPTLGEIGDALRDVSARIRQHDSVSPEDLATAGDALLADPDAPGQDRVLRALIRTALRLFSTVLASVRRLVRVAIVLALVDAALLGAALRDRSWWYVGAGVGLLVLAAPAWALHRVGKRFVEFRESIATLGERLPELLDVPRQLTRPLDEVGEVGEQATALADRGRIRRFVGSARLLLRLKSIFTDITSQHRDVLGAGTFVVGYGPLDVLLATWGVLGIVALAMAIPLLAVGALLGL